MKSAANDALVGRTIADKFKIESLLGSGAMGAVYRARQLALEKTVALKVMHGDLAEDAAFAARFHREAKAASRLDHPNSVRVLDFGEDQDGLLYIAMEYLDGKDLLALMRESWPLSGPRIIDVLMQTLSALGVAHELGIVHRDLKPENIMVLAQEDDEGRPVDIVKVCDFGIAKLTNDRASGTNPSLGKGPLTSSGTLVGTPEYMSPEQGRGDQLDARSDLYSIGVILFHLLTGRVPFTAENAIGIILKHITDDPPRPTSIAPHVDPRLETICLKAMRKRREDRYASAREMRADLRAVRDQVRGPMASADALPSERSSPDVSIAKTVNDLRAPAESTPSLETRRSATATSLATAVPALRPRRAWLAGVALASVVLGVGVGAMVVMQQRGGGTVRGVPPLSAAHSGGASEAPSVDLTPFAPLAPLASGEPAPFNHVAPPPSHGHPGKPAFAPPQPSAHAAAPPPAAPPASVAPTPAPTPQAPPAQAPPEGPAYDPSSAFVDVGSVTPSNVNGDAVRAAVRSAPLTRCYRDALRGRGRKSFGTGTLSLSIDEAGRVTGAILTGVDWLPEVTRCIQGGTTGLQLRSGAVESGGGTADVWLSFRAP